MAFGYWKLSRFSGARKKAVKQSDFVCILDKTFTQRTGIKQ
jgi:hypothetical protein